MSLAINIANQQPSATPVLLSSTRAKTSVRERYRAFTSALLATLLLSMLPANAMADDSIWSSMRRNFALPASDNPAVAQRINWFKRNSLHVERTTQRAQPYLHYILEQVKQRGLPMEVALIPLVESAFDPYAHSTAAASGLWQLMPTTADRFKVKQGWWYDGRRDVIESTRAALDYLEILARRFDGDWLHMLAAYNSGGGTVNSAIRRARKAGKPDDFWNLDLPKETRGYVPTILALAEIIRRPRYHGVHLHNIRNERALEVVHTELQLDLAMAAEMADLPLVELYHLNAGFSRWATDPAGPHRILLPVDRVDEFKRRLAETPLHKRTRWTRYQVRSGDSLRTIAQRHHSTTAIVKAVNRLDSDNLATGRYLLIPTASRELHEYPLAAAQRIERASQQQQRLRQVSYRVKSGDSLSTIAAKYNVKTRDLARWNSMRATETLRAGRTLTVWAVKMHTPNQKTIRYTVRNGDSLSLIGKRHNVSVANLRRWNNLQDQQYIKPGQQLLLHIAPPGQRS